MNEKKDKIITGISKITNNNNHNRRLHIDDFANDEAAEATEKNEFYHFPSSNNNAEIEGWSTNYIKINIVKLYSVIEKIPAIFFLIAWSSYFIDPYIPEWDYDGWFIRFNFVNKPTNFIVCDASTINSTNYWAPSLLRMINLHSISSIFLRASILPLFFGRLLLLSIILGKWRYLRNDYKIFKIFEGFMYALMIMEIFSLSIFVIGNHPVDDERIHKLIGIIFVFITVINMIAITLIIFHIDRLRENTYTWIALSIFTFIFASTVCLVLNSYYEFVDNRLCSPLVANHLFVLEIAAIMSYIFFHWKSKANIEDVEILLFSSISDLDPQTYDKFNYKSRMVENSIKKFENIELKNNFKK